MATRKATPAAAELQSLIADGEKSPSAMTAELEKEKEKETQAAIPAAPEPKALPAATWDAGLYQLPQYRPVVTGPDGAQWKCEHHWGHGDEKAARKCAGSLASKAGLSIS